MPSSEKAPKRSLSRLVYCVPRRQSTLTHTHSWGCCSEAQIPSLLLPHEKLCCHLSAITARCRRPVWECHPSFGALFPWEMALRFQTAPSMQKPTFGTAATWQWRRQSWFPWQPLLSGPRPVYMLHGNPNHCSYWKLLPKRQ